VMTPAGPYATVTWRDLDRDAVRVIGADSGL
jgi:hypothetical protein